MLSIQFDQTNPVHGDETGSVRSAKAVEFHNFDEFATSLSYDHIDFTIILATGHERHGFARIPRPCEDLGQVYCFDALARVTAASRFSAKCLLVFRQIRDGPQMGRFDTNLHDARQREV